MACCTCCCENKGRVCCNSVCCQEAEYCCGTTCCPDAQVCCDDVCCDVDETCCGGECCADGNYCCDGVCQEDPCDECTVDADCEYCQTGYYEVIVGGNLFCCPDGNPYDPVSQTCSGGSPAAPSQGYCCDGQCSEEECPP